MAGRPSIDEQHPPIKRKERGLNQEFSKRKDMIAIAT